MDSVQKKRPWTRLTESFYYICDVAMPAAYGRRPGHVLSDRITSPPQPRCVDKSTAPGRRTCLILRLGDIYEVVSASCQLLGLGGTHGTSLAPSPTTFLTISSPYISSAVLVSTPLKLRRGTPLANSWSTSSRVRPLSSGMKKYVSTIIMKVRDP